MLLRPGKNGSGEIQKSLTLLGVPALFCLHPRRVGIFHVEIGSQKVSEKTSGKREE